MEVNDQIIIYNSEDGQAQIDVRLEEDTIWLNLNQISELFGRDKSVVSRHLNNIFKTGELTREATVAKYATVQKEGGREVTRDIEHFNLDAIISVGYRVNSKHGTQFRIWATGVLRDHLVKGYTLNQKRLVSSQQKYNELKQAINLVAKTGSVKELSSDEAKGILKVLENYAFALDTLDKFDKQSLQIKEKEDKGYWKLTYDDAIRQINTWREAQQAGKLFGNQKDQSFKSSLEAINQTYEGSDVYPSIEEKAAHLLYFIVKNHSFTDGNKRIAAGLFIYFLDQNNRLYKEDGSKIIGDNALVAITIMIAESNPKEKDMMIRLIVNLISNISK